MWYRNKRGALREIEDGPRDKVYGKRNPDNDSSGQLRQVHSAEYVKHPQILYRTRCIVGVPGTVLLTIGVLTVRGVLEQKHSVKLHNAVTI